MSTVTKQIAAVEFQANSRMANAAIESMRKSAQDCRTEVEKLQGDLAKGLTMTIVNGQDMDINQRIKELKAMAKAFDQAAQSQVRGVKAFDELWKHAKTGSIEQLTGAQIKAGMNGAKPQLDRLKLGSDEDRAKVSAIQSMLDESQKVLNRMKLDTDQLIQTLQSGEGVAEATLKRERDGLREMLTLIPQGTKEWKAYSSQLSEIEKGLQAITIEQQRATGKDTLGRAFRGDFAGADAQTLEQTITKLKEYQSVIDDPRGKGARHFAAAETQIKQLQSTLDQLKGKYTSADEVIQRFNQHLGETKMERVNTQAQTLAQTLDEKLSQATSEWDEDIQRETENLNRYEQELKETQERLASLQAEYDKVQQRYQSRSALGKATLGRRDKKRMAELDFEINGDDEYMGEKDWVEDHQDSIKLTKEHLQWYKQQKAEALGLTETVEQLNQAELQGEEKKQEARRMTREQMQQGIKVLEDEAFAIDRTTSEGKARYEQLRQTIDQMNEEIKVAANEMMSFADAQALADKAMEEQALTTKTGWAASTEELKRAEQTLADKVAKAKRGTAEEEAAYQKLVRQLQAVRTELGAGSMSGKQMMDVLSNPKNVTSVDTLKAAIGRARQELDALGRRLDQAKQSGQSGEVKKLQKTYDELAKSVQQTDIRMKELQNSSKGTASAFDKAWSRLKTYVGLYVGAAVAMQKLSQAMGDLLTLSDKMGEVRKTTGFTADEVGRLSNNLAKLDTRTTLTSLMELSSLAGSVGLKTQEQVQGFTEAADQLIVALPELGNESARTIIKIANATGDLEKNGGNVRETLEKVGSTIIALRANSASAAGPITDFVSRVGAVGAQAGISIDQIAALGSTIDALGGRVEMSATALSRMIPAIKNNSFAIANSIGVTEKYLKSLAPMEQMVLIFQKMRDNIQHIDTSTEEGMNAMADNVEAMLGKNATMREVMKDLEQQGARAGIVFGLLSQNVDELEKQLGIASEAYRENTALANEFANMNETAAAKWERLKNQVEEMFVGDSAQRFLGGIIDVLRKIVDLLAGNVTGAWHLLTAAIYAAIAAWSVFKVNIGPAVWEALVIGLTKVKNAVVMLTTLKGWRSMRDSIVLLGMETKQYIALKWALVKAHTEEEKAAIRARLANNALSKSLNANVILAIVAAIWAAVFALKKWYEQAHMVEKFTRDALASATAEIDSTTKKVDKLFESVDNARRAVGDAHLEVEKAEKAVREAKKALDEGRGSVEDLEKAENDLKIAHQQVTTANYEHKASIEQINKLYSPYLGYMLSEISTAAELANARELINAKLRETILLKQRESAYDRVEGEFGEKRDKERKDLYSEIDRYVKDVDKAARLRRDLNDLAKKYAGTDEDFSSQRTKGGGELAKILKSYGMQMSSYANAYSQIKGAFTDLYKQEQKIAEARNLVDDSFNADLKAARVGTENTKGTQQELREQFKAIDEGDKGESNGLKSLEKRYRNADKKNRKQRAADLLKQMDAAEALLNNAKNYYDLKDEKEAKSYKTLIDNGNKRLKGLRAQREQLLKEAGDAYKPVQGSNSGAGGTGGGGQFNNGSNSPTPYGTYNRITSPYIDWDADALVSRRKEMLERVRALANGADVQAVLSEDAKFITEATRNNIKTTRDAIEWYNTERLKIQDALHEKHLTNTGDWMDPTGRKKREKTIKDEWSTYLNELDAYYTERKAKIQEQQNDGEISEAESWRRQLTNEAEWRQRRAELQQLYARKSAEVTEEEQQAIFNIIGERTGDSADFIRASIAKTVKFIYDIGKHSEAEMNNLFGRMDKGSEQDFLRQRNAIGKQMDAIRDIIEKERPFNGITENLQENLTKMGVLFGDMDDEMKRLMAAGEDMAKFNAKQEQERVRRLSFLLQEAEHAYNTNIEEVMRHMAEVGMTAWVDYFKNNTDAQNALMAQLHTTFDKVQEAIKKEASLWKKEAENMWNNILLPDGETTLKQLADRTVAALSLDENRVSRANSLIGAGQASERVADRLALQQMRVQLAMQEHYYNIMHQRGRAAIDDLERQAKLARERGDIEEATRKELDAQHARMTLNLATAKEETDLAKQREEIIARTEESQNRLYTAMKEWADLLSSSLQSVFEATHAGDAEYFNERAKLNLTGKGGPGAGTYIVIDNEGTSDATAHYEYLNEREALERQREIANQNALADAMKKALDDINMKMSEQITDWINASLQSASIDANTQAVLANTEALYETAGEPAAKPQGTVAAGGNGRAAAYGEGGGEWMPPMEMPEKEPGAEYVAPWTKWAEVSSKATETMVNNNKKVEKSTKASFAAMTAAANMYGIAYQAMSNENLSTAQKVEMMIVQAAGQAAISMLTASLAASEGETAANAPSWISKTLKELGPIGGPVAVGVFTALIGGLMGLATSKITKSKSEIAQVTGASHASAGRLSTGMLQYAEGNVNEFTDPSTLQTGKQYNVDAADGRTYRARFMGKGAKTHITHGPEFHLVGEAGREAIIDAKTTQNIRMNEPEIWRTIQILSGGGRISAMRRRGRGVAAFADGNVDEMGGVGDMGNVGGMSAEMTASLQASLDRNSDIMERIAAEGIKGIFDVYGKDGLVETYDRGKKTMSRYGKRY